jgi:gliding motility-associated-like protein
MKRIPLVCCLVILFGHFSFAQTWAWAKNGYGDIKANDFGGPVATDKHGNVYAAGDYTSTITFGSVTLNDNYDNLYVVKYNSAGKLLWAKQAGYKGYSSCYTSSITTDTAGNLFITGLFNDTIQFGTYTLMSAYSSAYYVVKYDSNGNVLWAKQSTSASAGWWASYVVTDKSGNSYITGAFADTIHFGTYTLTSPVVPGYYYYMANSFLIKYDPNGNILWAKQSESKGYVPYSTTYYYYTGDMVQPTSITTDDQNNIYITGNFNDTAEFGSNTLISVPQSKHYNVTNVFLVKYDDNGNALWARQSTCPANAITCNIIPYDSISGDTTYTTFDNVSSAAVTTDKAGNAYISGYFSDTVSFGSHTLVSSKKFITDAFLIKYSSLGNVMWIKQSTSKDSVNWMGNALSSDARNGIYLTGYSQPYYDTGYVVISDSADIKFGAFSLGISQNPYNYSYYGNPCFIIKFDTSGIATCGSIFNSLYVDLATDSSGKYIYIGSTFYDSLALGSIKLGASGGGGNPYVARWNSCCGSVVISGNDAICPGGSVTLTAEGGIGGYIWSDGETTSTVTVFPSVNTVYSVQSNDHSCQSKDSIKVSIHTKPVDTICCSTKVMAGQSVQLGVGPLVPGYTYSWTPEWWLTCSNCPDPQATPAETTMYVATINDSGCISKDSIEISIEGTCGVFFVPSAFSPNGDGQNDVLYVRGQCIADLDFVVFDRWGNQVFESHSLSNGWDGVYNGQPMNAGSFSYIVTGTTIYGNKISAHGNVALIR